MYTLLPSSPDAEHPDKGQALRKLMADVLIIVACISAIATSALSIFLALRLNRAESENPCPQATALEDVRVNNDDPRRALLEDHREYYSSEGFIYPDDRHVIISPQKSTIIQFINEDFGIKNCSLDISLPMHNSTDLNIHSGTNIDIWMLDNSQELGRHFQWVQAPKRQYLFAALKLHLEDETFSIPFRCSSQSFSTFELTCSEIEPEGKCYVEFWQRKDTGSPNGVYMTQREGIRVN
ncbi:hypothetical protein D9757_013279 [Collybiopsis confluens]|uniref:Ubiquitin 3 binding protein But2 C-terminal domain-containing protein n=1 Tax=Collybiopsis confluens TaxID=2823264 RepID=A0A8H5FX36_9AGAR|nr:hypothetical protein D9757_013279 [Collybiopsis confluens]